MTKHKTVYRNTINDVNNITKMKKEHIFIYKIIICIYLCLHLSEEIFITCK